MTAVFERILPDEPESRGQLLTNAVLAGVLLALAAIMAITAFRAQRPPAPDFYYAYFPAAHRLLEGASPYAVPHGDIAAGIAFVYPALSAVVFAPFALVGRSLGGDLYVLLCFLLVPLTLWAANVRDWRVYGLPLLWAPVVLGWEGGNVSVPLTCLVMLAWRYRDRPAVAGFITAFAISLKPFVWPLALWLVVTRRWRAAGFALAYGLALNALAWLLVGFDQFRVYVRLSKQVTDALSHGGYGMPAVAHYLGLGSAAGDGLLLLAAAVLTAALIRAGVKRLDRDAMILAVALMLVASPLVWSHYFVLLLVPLAISFPRAAPIWLVPCAMWVCPPSSAATGREAAVAWLVAGVCLVSALRKSPIGRPLADGGQQDTEHPAALARAG